MNRSVIGLFFLALVMASHAENIKAPLSEVPVKLTALNDITGTEKLLNFGSVYAAQWGVFVFDQRKTISDHGSFKNMYQYPFQPVFDKDHFEFNLIKHSIAGNYYYLFYRYRGYSVKNAFLWSVLSTLAFEFAVETLTEKPSIQDVYQTPVLGTVVGMGMEHLSRLFHSTDTSVGHFFGYVLNPFTLFMEEGDIVALPLYDQKTIGAAVTWNF